MAIEIVLTAIDQASPVIKSFAGEAEKALAAVSQAVQGVTASLLQMETSLETAGGSASALTKGLALSSFQEEISEASNSLEMLAEGSQEATQELDALNATNEEASQVSGEAQLAFHKEASAINALSASVGNKAGLAFANVELIRSALTEEQLKSAIKKVQANLAGVVNMARALGPAWFAFNEQATAQYLFELIESQRRIIELPVTGRGSDIMAVFQMGRPTFIGRPGMFQQGGFVTSPFGIAEEGEFVVRPGPARENASALEAINRGARAVGNFNFFITVQGDARKVNWRSIARQEIIPEIKRALSRQ